MVGYGFVGTTPARSILATRQRLAVSVRPRNGKAAGRVQGARMLTAEAARTAVGIYGVVVAGGGIGAFLKSKSKASLISGVMSGAMLAYAYAQGNIPLALGTAAALAVVFGVRLAKTKKVMPAGMLLALSAVFACIFAYALYA